MAIDRVGRILFKQQTSFPDVDQWTKFDYLGLLRYSTTLAAADEYSMVKTGRSLVSDAFYALSGQTPNTQDVLGANWGRVMAEPGFPSMPKDAAEQVAAILALSGMVARRVFEDAEAIAQAQDEQADGQSEATEDAAQPDLVLFTAAQVKDADDQGEALAVLAKGISAGIDGATPAERLDGAISLASKFDLALFSSILGFAQAYAQGAARENRSGREELTGYKRAGFSDDIDTHSLIKLSEGDLLTLIELAEESLPTYTFKSDDPQGRGACVVAHDQSSSMAGSSGYMGKTREEIARTLEVALSIVMLGQGRDLVSMLWSDKVEWYDTTGEWKTTVVPRTKVHTYGDPGIEEHLSYFMSGGTAVFPALEKAMKIAAEYADPCDVLLLSDMDFTGSAEEFSIKAQALTEEFRSSGGRIWGIFVGDSQPRPEYVAWLDGWTHAQTFTLGSGLGDIIHGMVRNPSTSKELL